MNTSVIYLVPFQEIFCKNIISATSTAFSYILVIRHGKVATAVCDIVITPEFTLMSPLLLRYSSRTNLGRTMFESELGWFLGLCKLKFMDIYLRKFYFLSNAVSSLRQTCAPGGLFSMAVLLCVYIPSRGQTRQVFGEPWVHWRSWHSYLSCMYYYYGMNAVWENGFSKLRFCNFNSCNFYVFLTRVELMLFF